jgi:hypothetical protein
MVPKVSKSVEKPSPTGSELRTATDEFNAVVSDFAAFKTPVDGMQKLRAVEAQNPRNAVVLAVNHKPIACTESGYLADSWSVTQLTVVRCEDAGFSKAPFSRGMSKQKLAEAKPLAAIEGTDLRLWSFKKASMAKGDRCDDINYTVSPGDTFNIFMDANRYKEMKRVADPSEHMLPTDDRGSVIPAYSLLEVTLASKNSDSALDKNSCVNILKVRRLPDDVTLHSVAPILSRLPSTLNDALLQSSEKALQSSCISNDIVKDKVAFYRKSLNPCMMCESMEMGDSGPGVRITHWSLEPTENINAIDIPSDVLLRACNAKSVEHAVALLQIAAAMDAVSIFVTHNSFDGRSGNSSLRGTPLVDVAKITAKIDINAFMVASNLESLCNDTGVDYFDGEGCGGQRIQLRITLAAVVKDTTLSDLPPSKDFPVMMPGFEDTKMYQCSIDLAPNPEAEPPKERVIGALVFNLNAAKRSATAVTAVTGKRKLNSMSWSA